MYVWQSFFITLLRNGWLVASRPLFFFDNPNDANKMMKKTTLLCAMALSALGAQAQGKANQPKRGTFSFTPQVGVALAKQANVAAYKATEASGFGASGYEPDARYNAGFTGGLEVGYQATADWALSLGFFYTQAGSKYKDFEEAATVNAETPHLVSGFAFTNQHHTFGYFTVPVMAHYYVAQGFSVKAGVELGFLTTAKREWDQTEYTLNRETNVTTFGKPQRCEMDLKNEAKSVAFAIPVGVSYEYEQVVLDARYHIPLTKAMETIDTRNRLFTLTVGYRF